MDTFEEWVESCKMPAVQQHEGRLLSLGITRDTFQRPSSEVVPELVASGIPSIPAADIVRAASTYFAAQERQRSMPMAVFWDMENVHIPSQLTGLRVAQYLKSKLAVFGSLHRQGFRVYASSTHHGLSEQQRSDLQLCGCLIIDTPHLGRKEVADKMIIVDAMSFAYEHADGATLVFVTGDTDYAYLLSTLNRNPKWKTILVCNSGIKDVLKLSAHHYMRWTDIVGQQAQLNTPTVAAFVSQVPAASAFASLANFSEQRALPARLTSTTAKSNAAALPPDHEPSAMQRMQSVESILAGEGPLDDDIAEADPAAEVLTQQEETEDDMNVLYYIMLDLAAQGLVSPLKAVVGSTLKQKNPLRFAEKESRQALFKRAMDPVTGFLAEQLLSNGHPVLSLNPAGVARTPLLGRDHGDLAPWTMVPSTSRGAAAGVMTAPPPYLHDAAAVLQPGSTPPKLVAALQIRPYFVRVKPAASLKNLPDETLAAAQETAYIYRDSGMAYFLFNAKWRAEKAARLIVEALPHEAAFFDASRFIYQQRALDMAANNPGGPLDVAAALRELKTYLETQPGAAPVLKTKVAQWALQTWPSHTKEDREIVFAAALDGAAVERGGGFMVAQGVGAQQCYVLASGAAAGPP